MIAIIAAMDVEVEAIKEVMETSEKVCASGITMYKGSIEGKKVILMKSGVGKGMAAMSLAILFENYVIDKVVNVGTAGGLKADQEVLDAVISTSVVQHDFDTTIIDGPEGLGLRFDADEALVNTCDEVLHEMQVRCMRGVIASGDQFIAEDDKLKRLETFFPEAICAEMEAGAIGQVCAHYHVPFVILRSLSDVAHKEDSHMDFLTYAKHASKRSATLCKELMKRI